MSDSNRSMATFLPLARVVWEEEQAWGDSAVEMPFRLKPDVYNITNPDTGNYVILVGHEVARKIFEIHVPIHFDEDRPVTLVTDSVEVLRGIASRGFPLALFAAALYHIGRSENPPAETFFDIARLSPTGEMGDREPFSLRAIRVAKDLTFDLRLIKE
jgi:hypothetical protein